MIAWLVLLQAGLTIAVAGPATSPEYLPLHLAQAEGLFTRQKLTVALRPLRSEAAAAEALAAGSAELAATSLEAALRLGAVAGAPPRLAFGLTAAPPVALLVATAHKDAIRAAADLAGRAVAIPAPGTPEDQVLDMLLGRARVPLHRVTVRSLGDRGAARALEAGQVAAAVLGEPYATRLVEDGKAVVLADLRTRTEAARWLGADTVSAAVFVRATSAPETTALQALARALLEARARLGSAEPEALRAVLPPAVTGSAPDFALRVRAARSALLPAGRVSRDALEASIDLIKARAPLPAKVRLPRRLDRLLFLEPLEGVLGPERP